jgi:mannose-6-phosphate isomerase-like protein (cupin superfamily)|tara:strand:- start:147 stop:596 length:450 start_codon:yes stop_codon:yes gene_type:complete
MHKFKEGYLKENNIDFNTLAEIISQNHLTHVITTNYLKEYALDSVFQIKNIEKDFRFKEIFNKLNFDLNKEKAPSDLSIFFSMMSGSCSSQHTDEENVHIIGLYGHTSYLLDKKIIMLKPGDRLYIEKGTPHKAVSLSPRIVFSFGIYN